MDDGIRPVTVIHLLKFANLKRSFAAQEVLVIGGRAEETDRYGNTVPVSLVTEPREFAKISTALVTEQLTNAGYHLAALLRVVGP